MLELKNKGGIEPLEVIIARARKLQAMDRIRLDEGKRLIDVLVEAVAIIENMTELNSEGEKVKK